ncbi:hypothetical protein BRC77_05275 [Halobacteriales archaeon QH_8_64_26]|jgi:hypothetical protein|nr:MAG: hypothetical protein BRC77_05275 [Halobacteriales archaeon QH_8_64_26]
MTDPVNLNVPGLPYLLFALAFFAVVALLAGLLSPIELALQRHYRSNRTDGEGTDGEGTDGDEGESGDDRARTGDGDGRGSPTPTDAAVSETDRPVGTDRNPDPDSGVAMTVYECRRCGATLDAGDEHCPRCETASIARYDVG